jgi:hypothetical protein
LNVFAGLEGVELIECALGVHDGQQRIGRHRWPASKHQVVEGVYDVAGPDGGVDRLRRYRSLCTVVQIMGGYERDGESEGYSG